MSLSARWFGVLLGLLVALGVGLRLHDLEQRSLWGDELGTLAIAQFYPLLPEQGQPWYRRIQVRQIGDGDTFLTAKAAEQSPPLNDLLEKATVNWLGATELAARLPAVLAACALLLWFAGFAWRHPDPYVRRVLRWSLLLLVLYPALVMYAKEGRAYSVGVSLVGMAGLLWMLRWRDGWRAWQPPGWVEIGLFTLACYSHYIAALLVVLLLSADAVMATRRRSGQAWGRLLTLGLVFLVWLVLNSHAILFTSVGGVAWRRLGAWEHVLTTLNDALAIMHPYWLGLGGFVLSGLVLLRRLRGQVLWSTPGLVRLGLLAGLTVLFIALAGMVTAKTGMAHPRFFIFILPFVAVMIGLVLAELRQRWQIAGAALLLVALAQPSMRLTLSSNNDDFRAMTLAGVRGSDKDTLFLYQWLPNRDIYRVYLERFLGQDPRSRMIGISTFPEAAQVCEQIKGHTHVVALGHVYGKGEIDAVYAYCGARWPQRSHEQFHNTFTEHWRAQRGDRLMATMTP
jgi:hypothetical protein